MVVRPCRGKCCLARRYRHQEFVARKRASTRMPFRFSEEKSPRSAGSGFHSLYQSMKSGRYGPVFRPRRPFVQSSSSSEMRLHGWREFVGGEYRNFDRGSFSLPLYRMRGMTSLRSAHLMAIKAAVNVRRL